MGDHANQKITTQIKDGRKYQKNGQTGHYYTYTRTKGIRGMWKLQTQMHNANHIQDLAMTNNEKDNQDPAITNKQQSIWIQGNRR